MCSFYYLLLNEVHSNYCKFVGLLCNFFAWPFCAFLLEHSLTSQATFSRFHYAFLTDLNCSHSEVKLVPNINWLQQTNLRVCWPHWAVLLVRDQEVNGSNPGVVKSVVPDYRLRAILPTLSVYVCIVVFCFIHKWLLMVIWLRHCLIW